MSSIKSLNNQSYSPINLDGLRPVQPNEFLPPVAQWATLGGVVMLAIFAVAVIAAAVLKYPATVKALAMMRPTGELRIVQAGATGKVNRIEVKAYQAVQQGDAIAYLDNSRLQTQKQQLYSSIQQNQRQLAQINAQIQALQAQIAAETKAFQRAIAADEGDLKLNQRQYQERQIVTQAEVREAKAAARLAQEELGRYRALANTGAIPQVQISEKVAALEVAVARLQRTQAALNPSTASVEIATERIEQKRAQGISTLATLDKEREALIQQKVQLNKELTRDRTELQQVEKELTHTVIRSPVAGRIQQLNLRNLDQLVQIGDVLAQIAPSDVPLVVKAFVTPQDIGQIKIAQSAKIKVKGCPHTDFGTLAGKVITISPDVIVSQSQTAITSIQQVPLPISDARYEVTIQPQSFVLEAGDRLCNLEIGMDGSAEIVTRQETVLTFFFRKFKLLN
jgi:multidrug efflux pump subunit AcrA (membrane-fusion protein)